MAKINQAGMRMKGMEGMAPLKPPKMSKEQVMKRKRSMISNAAHKVMNRNYSK